MTRTDELLLDLQYIREALKLKRTVDGMTNCHECADEDCKYRPTFGNPSRYNCPLFRPYREVTE